jgi:hypothetical protein
LKSKIFFPENKINVNPICEEGPRASLWRLNRPSTVSTLTLQHSIPPHFQDERTKDHFDFSLLMVGASQDFCDLWLVGILRGHFIRPGFHDTQRSEKEGKSQQDWQSRRMNRDEWGQHVPEDGTDNQKYNGKNID